VRYGYRKILVLLRREGWQVGKHLVYRLYKEEGLALKRGPRSGVRRCGIAKSGSIQWHLIKLGVWTSLLISYKTEDASVL
jgi:hypothetical protein